MTSRILIVDDHPAARITIRSLLDWHSLQVCGEAQNGKEAMEKVLELKPDIVLLDITMPVMDGIQAAYEIRRVSPETKIVFLTVAEEPSVLGGALLWSHGFVSKSEAGTKLIPTLKQLASSTAAEGRKNHVRARRPTASRRR